MARRDDVEELALGTGVAEQDSRGPEEEVGVAVVGESGCGRGGEHIFPSC